MEDIFEEVARMRSRGEAGALATVIATRGSTPGKETMRLLVRANGSYQGTVGGGCIEAEVVSAAREVIEDETPRRLKFRLTEAETGASGLLCGGEIEVFIEPLTVPGLVLFGAGHISRDLCEIGARAGFHVTVVDDRDAFANAERFPAAHRIVTDATFADCFAQLEPGPATACVVVTRGHAMDLECADFALHSPAFYVGLIGSKVKIRALLRRLADAGRLQGVDLERLHAPIGLDLGAQTHGEIAVAVVAELVAHRRGVLEGLRTKRLSADDMRALGPRPAPSAPDSPSPSRTGRSG